MNWKESIEQGRGNINDTDIYISIGVYVKCKKIELYDIILNSHTVYHNIVHVYILSNLWYMFSFMFDALLLITNYEQSLNIKLIL